MSESKPKVLVVVAAGPLIGVGVAALFAQKGFSHIALLSRNAERLRQDAKDGGLPVGTDGTNIVVKTYAADVTIPDSLNSALREIEADFGAPEVVVYNGARVSLASMSNWDSWTEEDMVTDFRVSLVSQVFTCTYID
jgi:NAD(P)-dependent dehydrogenase (short-subunit alcohol dehydrogenase family)